jgi:hypothetical protein
MTLTWLPEFAVICVPRRCPMDVLQEDFLKITKHRPYRSGVFAQMVQSGAREHRAQDCQRGVQV